MGDFVLTEEFQSVVRPADEICTIFTYSPDELVERIQVQDLKNPTQLQGDELNISEHHSPSPDGTEMPEDTEVPDDAEAPDDVGVSDDAEAPVDTETSTQSFVASRKLPSTLSTQHFRARYVQYTG